MRLHRVVSKRPRLFSSMNVRHGTLLNRQLQGPLLGTSRGDGNLPQNDPMLQLSCPKCGRKLRYGTSSSSGRELAEPSLVYRPGADVHHYACTNGACGRFWMFGRETPLVEDPQKLADKA